MKKLGKQGLALVLSTLLLVGGALAAGLAEGESLISLSYLEQTYIPDVVEQGFEQTAARLEETFMVVSGVLDQLGDEYLHLAGAGKAGGYSGSYSRRTYSLYDTITLQTGSGILVEAGRVLVDHNGAVIDMTEGRTLASGSVLTADHRYIVAEDTQATFIVESDAARLAVEGAFLVRESSVTASPFTDITIYDYYHDAVNEAYVKGLFSGSGDGSVFVPDELLNRAMMMTVLFHVAGDPDEERFAATKTFTDVPEGEWYSSYVSWAGEQGISAGFGDGTFRPLQTLTRREVVQFLYNFCVSYLDLDLVERADLSGYPDVAALKEWGYDAMSWAVAVGMIDSLEPNAYPTRGEVAVIMANFAKSYL